MEFTSQKIPPRTRRIPPLDNAKLKDPECCARFQAIVAAAELPEWELDVNDHVAATNTLVTKATQACFGQTRLSSIKGYVQEETMGLVRLR
eukprot:3918295-Pyramimonas_sp.AAC.1